MENLSPTSLLSAAGVGGQDATMDEAMKNIAASFAQLLNQIVFNMIDEQNNMTKQWLEETNQ